jgi:hypothetical protein
MEVRRKRKAGSLISKGRPPCRDYRTYGLGSQGVAHREIAAKAPPCWMGRRESTKTPPPLQDASQGDGRQERERLSHSPALSSGRSACAKPQGKARPSSAVAGADEADFAPEEAMTKG